MNRAVLNSMTDSERLLVSETERAAIADLSEDDLLELHTRIRRARSKYLKNYRRAASASVPEAGGRGKAYAGNARDRDKAEVFELALARVSRQVAVRATQAAAELKAERIEAARQVSTGPAAPPAAEDEDRVPGRARTTRKTTGGIKKDASSRSMGARRQAQRDAK